MVQMIGDIIEGVNSLIAEAINGAPGGFSLLFDTARKSPARILIEN